MPVERVLKEMTASLYVIRCRSPWSPYNCLVNNIILRQLLTRPRILSAFLWSLLCAFFPFMCWFAADNRALNEYGILHYLGRYYVESFAK